jgi:hypothetical protein
VRAKGQPILDDIRAFRQSRVALRRNLQASSVAAPGFAIRCGNARAYAYKCGAACAAAGANRAIYLRPPFELNSCSSSSRHRSRVRFKSVLIDLAAAH